MDPRGHGLRWTGGLLHLMGRELTWRDLSSRESDAPVPRSLHPQHVVRYEKRLRSDTWEQ